MALTLPLLDALGGSVCPVVDDKLALAALPDFRGPGEALGEVDPLCGRSERGRWRRGLDDDVAIQGVHFALNATVRVLGILLLIAGVVVLEGVPLVVRVQAVLLDQGLGERTGSQLCWDVNAERFFSCQHVNHGDITYEHTARVYLPVPCTKFKCKLGIWHN